MNAFHLENKRKENSYSEKLRMIKLLSDILKILDIIF